MANIDAPFGFRPIRHLTGGMIGTTTYTVTTGATVYEGQLVKLVAGGTVEAGAATIGDDAIGVAAEYVDDSGSAGGKEVAVWDDPQIVFAVQASSGTALAATDVGATSDHIATHAGVTRGTNHRKVGVSRDELNSTTGQGQLKIIGLYDSPDNVWGEHAVIEVIFNEHLYKYPVTAV